jgi:hypothetical protein
MKGAENWKGVEVVVWVLLIMSVLAPSALGLYSFIVAVEVFLGGLQQGSGRNPKP